MECGVTTTEKPFEISLRGVSFREKELVAIDKNWNIESRLCLVKSLDDAWRAGFNEGVLD